MLDDNTGSAKRLRNDAMKIWARLRVTASTKNVLWWKTRRKVTRGLEI
jgi:hypothetical protein